MVSVKMFVQFVGDRGRLLDKARDKPDLTLHNSIKNNIRLFLNICEDSRSTADCAVYFPI